MVHTFATLPISQALGEGLAYPFSLPTPGPVIGMLLLFLLVKADAAPRLAL